MGERSYTYDADGNLLVEYTATECEEWDALKLLTYTYDADCSVLVSQFYPWDSDPDVVDHTWTFDADGRLTSYDSTPYTYEVVDCP